MPVFDQRDRTILVRRAKIQIDRMTQLSTVSRDTTGWHFYVHYGRKPVGGRWFPMHFDSELEAYAIRAILQEYIDARAV